LHHRIKYILQKKIEDYYFASILSFPEGVTSTVNQNLNSYTVHLCTQFNTKVLQVHVSRSF
jgi:hypothetical protein